MVDKVHSDPEDDPSVQETVMMGQKGANSAKTNTTTTSKCSKRDLCHQDWNQRHEQCIIANNNHFYNKLLKNKFILDSDILISFFPSKFLPEHLPKTKGLKFGPRSWPESRNWSTSNRIASKKGGWRTHTVLLNQEAAVAARPMKKEERRCGEDPEMYLIIQTKNHAVST